MTDFKDDINACIWAQNNSLSEERGRERRLAHEEAELKERVLKIGSEVVDLLRNHGLATSTIWVKKKIKEVPYVGRQGWRGTHSGVDHIFEYRTAGEAWKLFTTYGIDDGYYENDNVALRENGELLKYNSTETTPGPLALGPKAEGIVSPSLIRPKKALAVLEGDHFKDACAHLIRTRQPLRVEGNLFLDLESQSLDDNWQTKL